MPVARLTARMCETVKPTPGERQTDYRDETERNLTLRVTDRDRRTFYWFGRVHGKLVRRKIGELPATGLSDARAKCRDIKVQIDRGADPFSKKVAGSTLRTVADKWYEEYKRDRRTAAGVWRLFETRLFPALGDREAASIRRADIRDLIEKVYDPKTGKGATMARRFIAHLNVLFKWALAHDYIDTNPVAGVPKPGREVSRDRVLDMNELKTVWKDAEATGYPFGPFFQILILTAARRAEIAELRWDEIETAPNDEVSISLSGDRTKTGEPRLIPLSTQAVDIINALPQVAGCDYVFTTTGRSPISGFSKAKALIGKKLPEWRIHDLRRSVATGLQRQGERLEVTEAVLGHISGSRGGIVGIYQRYGFDAEKRIALDTWGRNFSN